MKLLHQQLNIDFRAVFMDIIANETEKRNVVSLLTRRPSLQKAFDLLTSELEEEEEGEILWVDYCSFCAQPSATEELPKCSLCRETQYCDEICQFKHWKEGQHSIHCSRVHAASTANRNNNSTDDEEKTPPPSPGKIMNSNKEEEKMEEEDVHEEGLFYECTYCHKTHTEALPKCERCKGVAYCNRNCQRAHWKDSHKRECLNQNEPDQNNKGVKNEIC